MSISEIDCVKIRTGSSLLQAQCKNTSKVKQWWLVWKYDDQKEFCLSHTRAENSLCIFAIKFVEQVAGSTVLTPWGTFISLQHDDKPLNDTTKMLIIMAQ